MTDWTGGYVSDIEYTTGFYRELSPMFLSYAALLQECRTPDLSRPFNYCELACGQGLGTTLLAALYPHATFTGIDFNPSHIAGARALAAEAELDNLSFREDSFQTAVDLPDDVLPPQDIIALHGTYTWISRENQQAVVRFIERKLKPGGLVYISYNAMPGWLPMMPLQYLMREHALQNPDRSDRQMDATLSFIDELGGADSEFFTTNPGVGPRLKQTRDKDRSYLVHEYLHGGWKPLYHTDMVRDLAEAKLDFLGSAQLLDNFPALSVPEKARALQQQAKDPAFRELIRDFAVNRQFRRDVFVKGRRRMTEFQRHAQMQALRFAPLRMREDMSFKFHTALGDATGQESLYGPLADALSEGGKSVRELQDAAGADFGKVFQALAALTSSGQVHPMLPGDTSEARDAARRLNRVLARFALMGEPYRYMAAPATGNGLAASDIEMAAFDALCDDDSLSAGDLGRAIWSRFRKVGRRLVKDGATLQSDAENLAELTRRAEIILQKRVPVWRTLGIL
jgi:SAM-dependent methyltransferase